jgi:hypothetical protein
VGPRTGLDDVEKRKLFLDPAEIRTPNPPVVQPVASRCTDCAITALKGASNIPNLVFTQTERIPNMIGKYLRSVCRREECCQIAACLLLQAPVTKPPCVPDTGCPVRQATSYEHLF